MRQETFIYDERANSVMSVFYFLIKKRVDVFYKGWFVFFATRGGAFLFTIEKSYLQFEKIKSKKKSYVQLEK